MKEPSPAASAAKLKKLSPLRPTLAIVLGSGFHHVLTELETLAEIPYEKLPGFPPVGVTGHAGRLLIGRIGGTEVILLSGRAHFYEGHPMAVVTFAVRTLAAYGIGDLLLTNAAGGVNTSFRAGDFMLITDHINLMGVNPLRGVVPDGLARFVDLTRTYDADLRRLLQLAARKCSIKLQRGVYLALSGPSFAVEVVSGQPTAVVVASKREQAAATTQRAFSSAYFRAYTHTDVIGVELGGALKNVMAVATGIAEGLGLGFNARAALVTRGLAEMTRLGSALGAEQSTFAGLAGLGDLVLTCTGSLSRNRAVGVELGKGRKLDDVLRDRETVAEGVVTAQSARALAAREGIEMPIVDTVNRVLFEGQPARSAIAALMTRELRAEVDR